MLEAALLHPDSRTTRRAQQVGWLRFWIGWFGIGVLAMACLVGCDRPAPEIQAEQLEHSGDYPIQITTTVGMVADIVRQVGGDHVQVHQLCGSGVDPHLFRPTRDDIAALLNADVVFYSGLMLEGKLSSSLAKAARNRVVIPVTSRLPDSTLLDDSEAGHHDPHVWMDVAAWSECVQVVSDRLSNYDPQHRDDYARNTRRYRQQLAELDAYGKQAIGSIPESRRVLVTSHDAFHYFGRAYGLQVLGVQGLSTESEAGLQKINQLVRMLAEQQIQAVFVESSVPRKNMEALIEGVRARGHQVSIGGELFSDAMGEAGTYEGTYVGMLDHNITLVTRALGGTAPAAGWQGRLSTSETHFSPSP